MLDQTVRVGIIGVGAIAEAMVEGLCRTDSPPRILLSPRSAQLSRSLAERFDEVEICPGNQEVVDGSDIVLLTVRPEDVDDVLSAVRVPRDRLVISAAAGWSCASLRALLGDVPVVRSIPLPAVRSRDGLTAIFPSHPMAEELFSRLGGVVAAPTEEGFSALSAATAAASSQLRYVAVVSEWLAARGLRPGGADRFARSLFRGVGRALEDESRPLDALVAAHETPGGINAELRGRWLDSGNEERLRDALDRILSRVEPS
ncbi:NAD(P)-binding domain-containing protein [Tsukamurella sp. 8F]|uniref:NAD(P)-binding domain-containing protein n=1 Tax=unclassified Tsukamurella TaxID=2633480 RepID=UPI0023B8890B|nr:MULTISPECIES: NAD(P)-binding domain-containing protein [unclassified Tsukamurella]MDF0531330.1 NAD(P)-binding domain-containing protein [Tsukamurella sp. 8J]MDF0588536.1 NAD(P)-binding domain-containing protein [Tsukamurella sp. 8F]